MGYLNYKTLAWGKDPHYLSSKTEYNEELNVKYPKLTK